MKKNQKWASNGFYYSVNIWYVTGLTEKYHYENYSDALRCANDFSQLNGIKRAEIWRSELQVTYYPKEGR